MNNIVYMLFKPYEVIINTIAMFSKHIDSSTRSILTHIFVICISIIGIINSSSELQIRTGLYSMLIIKIASVILILLLIVTINREVIVRHLKPNIIFWFGWILCFGMILLLSKFHFMIVDIIIWAVLSLTVYPMYMIVLSDREENTGLIKTVAQDMVISAFVFLMINIFLLPYIDNNGFREFQGIVVNPNSNGIICVPFFSGALYLLLTEKKHRVLYIIAISISLAFVVVSACRTAELAISLETIIAAIIVVRRTNWEDMLWTRKVVILLCIVGIIAFCLTSRLLIMLEDTTLNVYAATKYEEAWEWVNSSEVIERIDSISNGRLLMWKIYLNSFSLWGYGYDYDAFLADNKIDRMPHNGVIDVYHESGLFAALGYFIWLGCGIFFIVNTILNKNSFKKEYLFTALSFTGFFIENISESHLYPMNFTIVFLAYIMLAPIGFRDDQMYLKDNKISS